MADKMAAMKNFANIFFFIFTIYLMQNWVVSVTHLLLSNYQISVIFPIIDQSTLSLDHVPYAHSDSQTWTQTQTTLH